MNKLYIYIQKNATKMAYLPASHLNWEKKETAGPACSLMNPRCTTELVIVRLAES